jgi:hypothetical protein
VDPAVTALLSAAEPDVRPLVEGARALVLDVLPDGVHETVGGADVGYGWTRGYTDLICVIGVHARWVTLGIADGAALPDPHGLLRGAGKRHRHVRVAELADLQRDGLRELLAAAAAAHPAPEGRDDPNAPGRPASGPST